MHVAIVLEDSTPKYFYGKAFVLCIHCIWDCQHVVVLFLWKGDLYIG